MPIPNVRSCTIQGHRSPFRLPRSPRIAVLLLPPAHDPRRRTPSESRLHPVALIEDEESIQAALMEVINALLRNTIDPKRASLILRALNIATRNIRHMKYGIHDKEMIKEVPDYPAPPEPELESVPARGPMVRQHDPRRSRRQNPRRPRPSRQHSSRRDGCLRPSGGPDSPGRPALPSTPTSASTSRPKPPASVKEIYEKLRKGHPGGAQDRSPPRKRWVSQSQDDEPRRGERKWVSPPCHRRTQSYHNAFRVSGFRRASCWTAAISFPAPPRTRRLLRSSGQSVRPT